jgi:hypothetical protein
MEFAKKFALIPQEQFSKHVPTEKDMSDLDMEMSKILKSSLDEHEKIRKYYEILQKKMNLENFNLPWKKNEDSVDSENNFPPVPDVSKISTPKEESAGYDSMILNTVPQNMQKQASHLLQIVKKQPKMLSWNDKGEIFIRDTKLENTNIADLFNLIFTHKKKSVKAQDEFLKILYEMNTPKHYVKNKYLTLKDKSKRSTNKQLKNVKWTSYK